MPQLPTRSSVWRLLDLASGIAIGALLVLLMTTIFGPGRLTTSPAPQPAAIMTWKDGPWYGCTLATMDYGKYRAAGTDQADANAVTATWVCNGLLPPSYVTTPSATPTHP